MQAYTDVDREDDPYALPDVEVWQETVSVVRCRCGDYDLPYSTAHAEAITYCPSCELEAEVKDTKRTAWWYCYCLPGCLPDSGAYGPFKTEKKALAAAREK